MTADIDAVLSRLRERPECRDAVEVIERLTAENERMTEMDEQRYRFTVTLQNDTARLHDENRRLTAERDRLREAANVLAAVRADAMWLARLARGSSWPGEMAHRVEVAAERVLSLLGESPVPDEPRDERCGGTLGRRPYWMSPDQYDPCRCDLPAGHDPSPDDPSGHSCEHVRAPSHPTGEERDR